MVTINAGSNTLSAEKKIKFGDRIEFLIEKKGISKLWLADKLGITILHNISIILLHPLDELTTLVIFTKVSSLPEIFAIFS